MPVRLRHAITAFAVIAAGVLVAPAIGHAATVLMLSGTQLGPLSGPGMADELQGVMCESRNTCVTVDYPATIGPTSIPQGVTALQTALDKTSSTKIVFWLLAGRNRCFALDGGARRRPERAQP